jgi:WD40 repeat protein
MRRLLTILIVAASPILSTAADNSPRQSCEFSVIDGKRAVRSITPGEGYSQTLSRNRSPIRNPHLMAQVLWVDRNSELAIAQNVATTPDGSGILAGWWLNNQRFAAYASAGLETPVWRYDQYTPWMMPVAASNDKFSGSGSGLPAFLWQKDSPLPIDQINLGPAYNGGGVAFSGDGNLMAAAFTLGQNDAILVIYDIAAGDTIFTRTFDQARGLYGVDVSRDGSVAVVSCYDQIYVFDITSGAYRDSLFNASQVIAKVSGDGSLIAVGLFNGRVYLYAWNGSQYATRWAANTTHDWVTTVDVSDDGSTVACGTLDFVGSLYGGKFEMWDATTAEVLIDYTDFGDMVSSVALSADGNYAIAGCWGTYNRTFGDVVSCFIRESDVPIFQLRDDIDESGSIFAVAISDSGHYAAAGGKAVHARDMGNGGMLYSIQVRDPLVSDVAVSSIDDPGEFLDPGLAVTPTATFINVGLAPASFTAACTITDLDSDLVVYTSSSEVSDLGSFATYQVPFSPDFTMPSEGRFRFMFTAEMTGDEDTSNNTLSLVVRSWHDMQAISIASPFDEVTVNWACTPVATFKNLGSYMENCEISLSIRDSTDTEVFRTMGSVFNLAPYDEEEVQFDSWAPDLTGPYTVVFEALVPDDRNPEDNIITKSFRVTDEMIYDDNISDMAIWVDAYPSSTNRKFAERFDPNITLPFHISNFRFYLAPVDYTGYFDYVQITGELDGLPDTSSSIVRIDNPALPGPGNWASFDVEAGLTYQPLWVVLHWADGDNSATGPYIGADNTPPIDGQSYWYSDNSQYGWNFWRTSDWMIRMTVIEGGQGIENDYVIGLPRKISLAQNYPNPFNPTTRIGFSLPNPGNVRLEVFNNLGQTVRCLADSYFDAGYHSVTWDGRTDGGAEAASGMYYYRLTSGNHRISRKMTLLK